MKILIFRSGAFGDNLIITPAIRHLHNQGHELVVVTSKRGMEVFKDNPHISKLIQWKEETPIEKLEENIQYLKRKFKCEKIYNFSESIEVSLSQHPRSPNYKLPKFERLARFNRNFYEYSFEYIKESWDGVDLKPELFFNQNEIDDAIQYVGDFNFNVLLGLSGSGNNKTWPWSQDFAYNLCDKYPDVHIITVGDEKCRLIEPEREGRITNLCGKIPMRTAMALTSVVDLVIAPDTGIIHASGCFDTPKMCLLGHNTKECIVKHFRNDYSVEADSRLSPCSPCFYLIYNMKLQCPIADNHGAYCMEKGIPMETVLKQFEVVYAESQKRS
jgi:ADP-heptose:LPS heptosyltransferase